LTPIPRVALHAATTTAKGRCTGAQWISIWPDQQSTDASCGGRESGDEENAREILHADAE
jgi:hypothetical protein